MCPAASAAAIRPGAIGSTLVRTPKAALESVDP
jgi:hypothetical protein